MPSANKPCTTPDCKGWHSAFSKTTICRDCRNEVRRSKLRKCTCCGEYLAKETKGNYCSCCIAIRAEKAKKRCKTCNEELQRENTTGFCWTHLVQKRLEKADEKTKRTSPRPYTVAQLVKAASIATCTTEDEIKHDRFRFFVRIRFAITKLARPYFSTIRIAKLLGGKDHSTIVHAQVRANELMADKGFATLVRTIEREALAIAEKEKFKNERIAA